MAISIGSADTCVAVDDGDHKPVIAFDDPLAGMLVAGFHPLEKLCLLLGG